MDGDNGDLRIGLGVVELAAETFQARYRLGRQHAGVVTHVAGGLRQVFYPLGQSGRGGKSHERGHKQPEDAPMYSAKALHRSSLYAV